MRIRIEKYHDQGRSARWIAGELGRSPATVSRELRRLAADSADKGPGKLARNRGKPRAAAADLDPDDRIDAKTAPK
jgi:IS30 family transposase